MRKSNSIHSVLSSFFFFVFCTSVIMQMTFGITAGLAQITHVGDIGTAIIKDNATNDLVVTTTGAANTGDDIIIVYATHHSTNLTVSVTDAASNTYTEVSDAINVNGVRTYIFASYNSTALSSGSTITITQDPHGGYVPSARAAVVSVFNGLTDSYVEDQISTGTGNSDSPSSGTTGTTVQADELLIGGISTLGPVEDGIGTWDNSFSTGPRDGTTGDNVTTNVTASLGYRVVSSTGTYTASKTNIASRQWAAAITTFKTSPGPVIIVSNTSLSEFKIHPGVPSAPQSYTVSGILLTDDITITAPTDFELSLTGSGGWTSSLVLNQSGGSVSATDIYVRFNRSTAGASSGTITHTSSGATPRNVSVSGTASVVIHIGDIGSNYIKDDTNNDLVITTSDATNTGDDIIIVYATQHSTALTVSVTDAASNTYTEVSDVINLNGVRTYIFASYNSTALASSSTITITQDPHGGYIPIARAAVVSVFNGLTDSYVEDQISTGTGNSDSPSSGTTGTTAQDDELLIGAIGTRGPVDDYIGTWDNSFTTGPRNGTSGGSAGTNITASMGWQVVTSTGAYTASKTNITSRQWATAIATFKTSPGPVIIVSSTSLSNFSSQPSVPSAPQSYTVSGILLTDDITITAPTDFEISLTGSGGWTSSLVLTPTGGTLSETDIYVRFYRSAEGTSNGTITHTSSGATPRNVSVSGTAALRTLVYLGDIGSATIKDDTNNDLVITTTGATNPGDDIIIVYATLHSTNLIVSVADAASNTYTEVADAINLNGVRTYIFASYNSAALSSGSTITITQDPQGGYTPPARAAVVSVFNGLVDSNADDQTSTGSGSSTSPSSGPTGTTTQADELLIGAVGTRGPVDDNPGVWQNSFTTGPRDGTAGGSGSTNITASLGWQIVSVTGAYTASKTGITSREWGAAIATFKAGQLSYDDITSDYDGSDGFSAFIGHTDGDYISATATGGTITSIHAYRIDDNANTGNTVSPGTYFVDPFRYWGVRVFGDNPEYTVVYHYQGHLGINDETSLRLASRDNSSVTIWTVATGEAPVNHNITLTGQTGTEYALASIIGDNPLPVSLASFTAEAGNSGINLRWVTESELNNQGFILERAINASENFQQIASYINNQALRGQGTSNNSTEYFYTDQSVEDGITYYYRLADVQMNGNITYHNTINATTNSMITEFVLHDNYPNPFNPGTFIKFNIPNIDRTEKQVRITIYDALGRKVRELLDDKMEGGVHQIYWDGKNDLGSLVSSGIYFYELNSGQHRLIKKMSLIR